MAMSADEAQQKAAEQAAAFVAKFMEIILTPTIYLMMGVAFLMLVWGGAEYVFNANNPAKRQQGVQHLTWGIVGLVVMVSALAILTIAVNTFGLGKQLDCAQNPSGAGCNDEFKLP